MGDGRGRGVEMQARVQEKVQRHYVRHPDGGISSVDIRRPRGRPPGQYKFDPGPDVTVTYIGADVGYSVRFVVCPRCGWPTEQEPAMTRCRGCGRLWPIAGCELNAQRHFESASGLWTTTHPSDL